MSKYSKINFVYFMQKWMDSVPGQTFLNYAYSWGAAVVILGTLFKLTHLPGANVMLFLGMGTEVFVFFISAFDRPFDKSTIDMPLDNHMDDDVIDSMMGTQQQVAPAQPVVVPAQPAVVPVQPEVVHQPVAEQPETEYTEPTEQSMATQQTAVPEQPVIAGGTVIIGSGSTMRGSTMGGSTMGSTMGGSTMGGSTMGSTMGDTPSVAMEDGAEKKITFVQPTTPAPAISQETAEAMEEATTNYVERLNQLNETLLKVEQLSARLATDSEEMENLNRTLTGIARVYEMQLKSASQQITTQDSINEQTNIMAEKIAELNGIYARMIQAMTTNMPKQ